MDRGTWQATVYGVAKSQTRLKRHSLHTPIDFMSADVVKNLYSKARGMDSLPGWETKIPHAMEQLSPHVAIREVYGPW